MSRPVTVQWADEWGKVYEIHADVTLDRREGYDDVEITGVTFDYKAGYAPQRLDLEMFFKREDVKRASESIYARLADLALAEADTDLLDNECDRRYDEMRDEWDS